MTPSGQSDTSVNSFSRVSAFILCALDLPSVQILNVGMTQCVQVARKVICCQSHTHTRGRRGGHMSGRTGAVPKPQAKDRETRRIGIKTGQIQNAFPPHRYRPRRQAELALPFLKDDLTVLCETSKEPNVLTSFSQ